mmetsp:Transcript_3288/g.5458  ORF Transcript_3288/g.5458 Transcript_3288/m.5458 type:complete len:180 (+) Transcript_3288:682-1221(+)
MSAGVSNHSEAEALRLKKLGLIAEHAYGLIQVAEVIDKRARKVRLVKLRNPWGKFEWNGDWSDHSKLWTPELKRELNVKSDANDGTFWMSFEDFTEFFSRVQLCKYNDKHSFSYTTARAQATDNCYHLFDLVINEDGPQTIAVSQLDEMCLNRDPNYTYSNCRIVVLRLHQGSLMTGDL